jgi:dUTPase
MKGSKQRSIYGGAAGGDLSQQAVLDVSLRPAAQKVISTGCNPTINHTLKKVSPRCQQQNAFRTVQELFRIMDSSCFGHPAHPALCLKCLNVSKVTMHLEAVA